MTIRMKVSWQSGWKSVGKYPSKRSAVQSLDATLAAKPDVRQSEGITTLVAKFCHFGRVSRCSRLCWRSCCRGSVWWFAPGLVGVGVTLGSWPPIPGWSHRISWSSPGQGHIRFQLRLGGEELAVDVGCWGNVRRRNISLKEKKINVLRSSGSRLM